MQARQLKVSQKYYINSIHQYGVSLSSSGHYVMKQICYMVGVTFISIKTSAYNAAN